MSSTAQSLAGKKNLVLCLMRTVLLKLAAV